MGRNLSGRYGGVVVHDTTDTVSCSPHHTLSPNVARTLTLSLFVALFFGIVLVVELGNARLDFLLFLFSALCSVGAWALRQSTFTYYATLLLRFSEHTWVMEKVLPTQERLSAHGNTSELKEIVVRKIAMEDEAIFWSPVMVWRAEKIETARTYKYELGRFDREEEAWAFAEELGSRLGIPVESERCMGILAGVSNSSRRRPRTG